MSQLGARVLQRTARAIFAIAALRARRSRVSHRVTVKYRNHTQISKKHPLDRGEDRFFASFHVERLGAGRLAGGIERDLLHARFGLAQQFLAALLERLAALVDRDRFFERNFALFEPLDDRFELLDRALEGQALDVGIGGCRP